MAYNRKNLLKDILEIQQIYMKFRNEGHTGTWIFDNIIHPNYRISRRTLTNYLGINAKRELRGRISDKEMKAIIHTANAKY
jgi:hypothetical protein